MKVFIVLSAMLVACTMAAPSIMDNQVSSEYSSVNQVLKFFGSCGDSSDITTCLAVKGITALNRAARAANIEVIPGVTFTRDPAAGERLGKAISENEIMGSLPVEASEKSGRLLNLAMDSASKFITSHNLQFKLPADATETLARSIEEGRGKMKKFMGPLAMALGAKVFALLPLFLGGVTLLVLKAAIVAKIAFVLAAILTAQKMSGGGGSGGSPLNLLSKVAGGMGGGGASANAGWSSGGGGASSGWSNTGAASAQYPYARSYDDAQDIAYSAQAPQQ